jgi:hypothetical protein
MKSHQEKDAFECKDFGKSCGTGSDLAVHMKTHVKECEDCGKVFKNAAGLGSHRRMHMKRTVTPSAVRAGTKASLSGGSAGADKTGGAKTKDIGLYRYYFAFKFASILILLDSFGCKLAV